MGWSLPCGLYLLFPDRYPFLQATPAKTRYQPFRFVRCYTHHCRSVVGCIEIGPSHTARHFRHGLSGIPFRSVCRLSAPSPIFSRNGIWFFWPAWPFAGWAIYAWRRQWRSAHVLLPLLFTATFLVLAFFNPQKEETVLLSFLPPLAILAALGLPTMKRGAINAIDWFSVMTLTLCALFIWLAWFARHTGWPAGIARNATKLAPGFLPEFNIPVTAFAACATIGWFALVYWRRSRQPSVLWRAVVLSTGGVILCWVLLATLWLPWINYSKSYAGIATEMATRIPDKNSCISTKCFRCPEGIIRILRESPFRRFRRGTLPLSAIG